MKTGADLVTEAKARIKEVTTADVRAAQQRGEAPVLLDVREPNETGLGRAKGAVVIPRGVLESSIEARVPRDRPVVIYCASGNRSALAADTMQQMGYENVASLKGGFRAWATEGGEVEG
jgi:rhodanese-related sulfurtransferase